MIKPQQLNLIQRRRRRIREVRKLAEVVISLRTTSGASPFLAAANRKLAAEYSAEAFLIAREWFGK